MGRTENYGSGLFYSQGRWIIYCRDGTFLWYSRGVVAASLGRLLRADEIVHHADGDTTNDALSNLVVLTRAEHLALHRADVLGARVMPKGDDHWMRREPERVRRGARHPRALLSQEQADEVRIMAAEDWPHAAIARHFGISRGTIHNIVSGVSYV